MFELFQQMLKQQMEFEPSKSVTENTLEVYHCMLVDVFELIGGSCLDNADKNIAYCNLALEVIKKLTGDQK